MPMFATKPLVGVCALLLGLLVHSAAAETIVATDGFNGWHQCILQLSNAVADAVELAIEPVP